jgi:hypothetical protein
MKRLLLVLVPLVVVGAGAALFVIGGQQEDDAADRLAAAQTAADSVAADQTAQEELEGRVAEARRLRRDLTQQLADLRSTSDQLVERDREALAIADRLIAALRGRDYDGYNAGIVEAESASEARHAAQSPFSGDEAQLNGLANQVQEAVADDGG